MIYPTARKLILCLHVATSGILLNACSGSNDHYYADIDNPNTIIDGSGTAPPDGAITGTIDGFGSVIVDGVRYSTENSAFFVEGEESTENELSVGDFITLFIKNDPETGEPKAARIFHEPPVKGIIKEIDLTQGTVQILHQTIVITGETLFDSAITPRSIHGLSVDSSIEVSGPSNEQGHIVATHISPINKGIAVLSGQATSINQDMQSLVVMGVLVDFSQATQLDDFKEGDAISVGGQYNNETGTFVANHIRRRFDRGAAPEGLAVTAEGVVSESHHDEFQLSGQTVRLTPETQFENGTRANILSNSQLTVSGHFGHNNHLIADNITFTLKLDIQHFEGAVTNIGDITFHPENHRETGELWLDEQHILINEETKLRGIGREFRFKRAQLSDIRIGDTITVAGHDQDDDFIANVIELDRRSDSEQQPRGPENKPRRGPQP